MGETLGGAALGVSPQAVAAGIGERADPRAVLADRVDQLYGQMWLGIVTTLDGTPISEGEIAGPVIPVHDNFQTGQKFITGGGRRGLQEQVLLSGSWNINPWFAVVEQGLARGEYRLPLPLVDRHLVGFDVEVHSRAGLELARHVRVELEPARGHERVRERLGAERGGEAVLVDLGRPELRGVARRCIS